MTEIIIGVVAGVLTSAFITALKALWDNSISPFIAKLRYQGVDVDGAWNGMFDDLVNQIHSETRLLIEQNAHEIKGTFTFSYRSPQKNFTLDFNVKGHIWEGYLSVNCLPKDRRVTSYAIALLKIQGGGLSLAGQYCFRNVDIDLVSVIPISLNRSVSLPGQVGLRAAQAAPAQSQPEAATPAPVPFDTAPHPDAPELPDPAPPVRIVAGS